MKRQPNESFEDYKKRRKEENERVKSYLKNPFRTFFPKPKSKPERIETDFECSANGKRHKNEMLSDFKERRKVCNAKRRKREKERKYLLTPKPELIGTLEEILG